MQSSRPDRRPLSWLNLIFLASVHGLAVAGTIVYAALHGVSPGAALIGVVLTTITILSISMGYHRLFSHRTFEAHPVLRFLLLAFGASAFQNTAKIWSAGHRRHHRHVDSDLDPYNAKRGFWYSHIGWVLRRDTGETPRTPVPDLDADALVAWQHRHYVALGALFGFVLPFLLGLLVGDPWGGLVLGGFVRLVFVYQATFSINSIAHMIGAQPYSDRDTSRDSFVTALVSMGEGYHNFHHTFPRDYRNGFRRHQFDPSKWLIRALATVGVTRNLQRTPQSAVLRARVRMEQRRIDVEALPAPTGKRVAEARAAVDAALARWHALARRYEALKADTGARWAQGVRDVRAQLRAAWRDVRTAYASWRDLLRSPEVAFAVA